MRRWLGVTVATLAGLSAHGEESTGTVSGRVTARRDGALVDASDVIVYVVGFEEAAPPDVVEIRQRDKHFVPDLVAITAGQKVSFPNRDPFYHNVFSPSDLHKFDLGQYPKGETKTKRFPAVGVIDVFCNIHPEMAATILVLPNRHFIRPASDGRFRMTGLPIGRFTMYAYGRGMTEPAHIALAIQPGATATVMLEVELTSAVAPHPNKFGEPYRDPERYR